MRMLLLAFLVALTAGARDLESLCWFYAGFDSPIRIAGGEFPTQPAAAGYREGRYGQGYYFHSPSANALPPMAEFLTDAANFTVSGGAKLTTGSPLRFSGGTLTVASRHVTLGYASPWVSLVNGYTCSFYAKGPVGAKVTARVVLAPLTDADMSAIEKKSSSTTNWKPLSSAALIAETAEPRTWELNGEWQRFYATSRFDNRTAAVGRDVSLVIETDAPVDLKDFQYQQVSQYPNLEKFNPTVYVDGGQSVKIAALSTSDPMFLKRFPFEEGSFSVWVRCFEADAEPSHAFGVWGLAKSWSQNWEFDGKNFYTGNGNNRRTTCYDNSFEMPWQWRHYAGTWKDGVMSVYVDGVKLESRTKTGVSFEDLTGSSAVFRVGTTRDGMPAADCVVDDLAIFSTALTDDEVAAIAASDKSLFAGSTKLMANPISFETFYRNDTNAAIRTFLRAPVAAVYTVTSRVAGDELPPFTLRVGAGRNRLAVPFDVARLRPGRYPYSFEVKDGEGNVALAMSGELKVRERLERDAFRIFSWGGSKTIHQQFMREMGVNSYNVSGEAAVRSANDGGFFPNIRYENAGKIKSYDFDYAALASEATNDLAYAEGLHTWVSTLVNSEVYGCSSVWNFTNCATFVDCARREIGCEPEWSYGDGVNAASIANFSKTGQTRPTGVWDGDNRTYKTLYWVLDTGMPAYRQAWANAAAIHTIAPDNCVWTEPILDPDGMGLGMDMMADWSYANNERTVLGKWRSSGGMQRAIGKPFMPTLGPGYGSGKGRNPDAPEGSAAISLMQTCDNFKIESWISLCATPCSHLSIFGLDAWEYAVSNAVALAEDPTATPSTLAEPDAALQYGQFVRERFTPVAELLRDLENTRAPLAVLMTGENLHAGDLGWGTAHYPNAIYSVLTEAGIPYDVLHDHEIDAEHLKQYTYVFFPMSRIITVEHDAALKEAANAGTVIVFDKYATNVSDYPGAIQLTDCKYVSTSSEAARLNGVRPALLGWATNELDRMRMELPSWSDKDFTVTPQSYTFEKRLDGVRYVTVVNNARCRGDSLLTRFSTNNTDRLHGAAQTITTHLKLASGAAAYEFNRGLGGLEGLGGPGTVTLDYGPAEAKTFAVYPRKLRRLDAQLDGDFRTGHTSWLEVSIYDQGNNLAPGRQVVKLEVRDPYGAVRDESGFYSLNGTRRIPLRFSRSDPLGKTDWTWHLEVTELTTGFSMTHDFVCTEDTSAEATNYVTVVGSPDCCGDVTYGEIAYRGADAVVEWSAGSNLVTWADGARAITVSDTERAVFLGWTLTNGVGQVTEGTEPTFRWNRQQGDVLTVRWRSETGIDTRPVVNLGEAKSTPGVDFAGARVVLDLGDDFFAGGEIVSAALAVEGTEQSIAGAVDAVSHRVTFEVDPSVAVPADVLHGDITLSVGEDRYVRTVEVAQGRTVVVEASDGWIRVGETDVEGQLAVTPEHPSPDASVVVLRTRLVVGECDAGEGFTPEDHFGIVLKDIDDVLRYVFRTADGSATNMSVAVDQRQSADIEMVADYGRHMVTYVVDGATNGPYALNPQLKRTSSVHFVGNGRFDFLNGDYEVNALSTNVARIGETEYPTVAAALESGKAGDIVLLWDASLTPVKGVDRVIVVNGRRLVVRGDMLARVIDNGDGTIRVLVMSEEEIKPAEVRIEGDTIRISVADAKPGFRYGITRTADLGKTSFKVDEQSWVRGEDIISGTGALEVKKSPQVQSEFFKVVVEAAE